MRSKGYCLASMLGLCFSLAVHAAPPDLLLLTKYRPEMVIDGWLMSEKLDGVRAYWDGQQLLSRQGNVIAAPGWFTRPLPDFELDGELWIARGQFEQTLSIISTEQASQGWYGITYNIFEVPHVPGGLELRLGHLRHYLQEHPIAHLRIIPQLVCRDAEQLNARLMALTAGGAEGLVLRNPHSPYQTGRSANALKVKRFEDMEGRVVGYRGGKGKYRGMTGALWIEIEGGRRFYLGSGLSDQERLTPPALGSVITFKYQGFTNRDLPRFASFLRIRSAP